MSSSDEAEAPETRREMEQEPRIEAGSTQSVGYGKPPKANRFQKGCSGNPKGRPKGSLNVAMAFIKALREHVIINENGKRKTVTKLEAALKQLVNKAAGGDLPALRLFLESARDAEAKQNAGGTQSSLINELDHEVINDLLKRFEAPKEEERERPEGQEGDNGDNERS